uniref:Bone morphotic protein 15 n=1 Tax=Sphenodon punctatus TaxID=8508 RepID=A0A8D0HUQ5_SPHPU
MVGLDQLYSFGALFFLLFVALLPQELSVGEAGKKPAADLDSLVGAPSLPLIQVLLDIAPASGRPQRHHKKLARGQHLSYMLNLYRSVADRHGRPRRNHRLDTNAVRLVRPFASVQEPEAGPWLLRTLDYLLQVQPHVEHLVRATVVYSQHLMLAHSHLLCAVEPLSGKEATPKLLLNSTALWGGRKNTTASSAKDGWVERDLTPHLQPWAWDTKQSHVLRLSHLCIQPVPAQHLGSEPGWEETAFLNDPFLLLYLNDSQRGLQAELGASSLEVATLLQKAPRRPVQTRKTRQASKLVLDLPHYPQKNSIEKGECSLRPFRVSFRQLGWDHWIIAPHLYNPKYCKGNCPHVLRYGYNSPNHAIIQNFINELVDQSVPRPSCVPYKYSPISVLMEDQNGDVLYKEYENMIAQSCTCR